MPKTWRIAIILLCAAVLILLLWRSPPKEFSQLLTPKAQLHTYPSSYLSGVRTTQYDKNGQVSYYLNAARAEFYPQQGEKPELLMDKPQLTLFTQKQPTAPWNISSQQAQGSEQSDELLLIDQVVIEQHQANGHRMRLTTDKLRVKPNRRYAETDKPVMITDPTGTTKATGLKVFFDEERIELLSNVKGRYQVQ